MIDSHTYLKPIFCLLPLLRRKDSSVVDHYIDLLTDFFYILAELLDRLLIRQVQGEVKQIATLTS